MDIRFITQRVADGISPLDVIELYNCSEDGYSPGEYTVGNVEPETREVTLIGMGWLSGYIAVVYLDDAPAEPGEQQ